MSRLGRRAGQTTIESLLLIPFLLMLIFGVLQIGMLGMGVVMSNTAVYSISRQTVQSGSWNPSKYQMIFQDRAVGHNGNVWIGKSTALGTGGVQDIIVWGGYEMPALPLVGPILGAVLKNTYADAIIRKNPIGAQKMVGPFAFGFSGGKYVFGIFAFNRTRLNFVPPESEDSPLEDRF